MNEGKEGEHLALLTYLGPNDVFQWREGGPLFQYGEPVEVPFSVAAEILESRWGDDFEVEKEG